MKLKEAISIVLNKAQESVLEESPTSEGDEALEAVELLREFYFRYGNFFDNFDENIDVNNYMFIQKPPSDMPNE